MEQQQPIRLAPYVTRFLIVFVLLQILLLFATQLLRLPSHPGFAIATMIGAALVAGRMFVVDHKRPFSDGEKLRISAYSLYVVLLIYGIRAGIGFYHLAGLQGGSLSKALQQFEPQVVLALVAGTAVMAFVSLFFAYGFLLSFIYRGMHRRGEL